MLNPAQLKNIPENSVYKAVETPLGELVIIGSERGLSAVVWDKHQANLNKAALNYQPDNPLLKKTDTALTAYFKGEQTDFDLPLDIIGSDFQRQAWQQLRAIPYGTTLSYGEQAKRLGDKNKARAVGAANALNPLSIIIPCHRVIGANGKLTGFAGGLDKKAYLLALEANNYVKSA